MHEFIDFYMTYHTVCLAIEFNSSDLSEKATFESDEAHLVINLQSSRTLAMRGEKKLGIQI